MNESRRDWEKLRQNVPTSRWERFLDQLAGIREGWRVRLWPFRR